MAQQRKSPHSGSPMNKPIAKQAAGKPAAAKRAPSRPASSSQPARPPRKPGKSIVNQRQTPWTLIIVVAVLVLFAGGVVAFAVTRSGGSSSSPTTRWTLPEVAAAKKIKGLIYHQEPNHLHVPAQGHPSAIVKYDTNPPTGGDHSGYWAPNCGAVYTHQLANENAVHMLEHGAVWITYNPKTATAADIATLKNDVEGVSYMALTPYAGLKTPISLQAWNYQLFVQKASDPRIAQFIEALRANPNSTPELNVSCTDPGFNAAQSYPGHPYNG